MKFVKFKSLEKNQLYGIYIVFREWTSQQIGEKQRLLDEQRKADQLYDIKAIELDQRASEVCVCVCVMQSDMDVYGVVLQLAAAEEQTRRNLNVSAKQQNLKMVSHILPCDGIDKGCTCMYGIVSRLVVLVYHKYESCQNASA